MDAGGGKGGGQMAGIRAKGGGGDGGGDKEAEGEGERGDGSETRIIEREKKMT